jgi:hypothetical protein
LFRVFTGLGLDAPAPFRPGPGDRSAR